MTSTVRPNEGLLLLISDAVVIAFVAATQCALFCGAGSCAPCTSISLAQTVCFVFDYSALRTSLVTLTAMVEAIEGSDATAEELSGQMERIWELGNEVVVPAFDRSLEAYRADGEHHILWLILIWLVEMLLLNRDRQAANHDIHVCYVDSGRLLRRSSVGATLSTAGRLWLSYPCAGAPVRWCGLVAHS